MTTHNCPALQNHISKEEFDFPEDANSNGAQADAIEKYGDQWYILINGREYIIEIDFCPFCGTELK